MSIIQTVSIICMWFGIAVLMYYAFSDVFNPPRWLRGIRRWRADSRLRNELRGHSAATGAVVYWDRYRNLSKVELFEVAGEFGWSYAGQQVVPDGWELQFAKDSAGAH